MSRRVKLKNDDLLDSCSIISTDKGFNFDGTINQIELGYDNSSWIPTNLYNAGAKKIFCARSKENPTDEGEFSIAYKNTRCYPYTDGAFYQGIEGNRCLDTSCIKKIYEGNSNWRDTNLGIDVSGYDFLILVSSHQSVIVPANFSINLTWNGWYGPAEKDVVTQRQIWRENNDIRWGPCYYRGINSYTGFAQIEDIDYPKQVYGIKLSNQL